MALMEDLLQPIVGNPVTGPFAQTEYGLFLIVVGTFLVLGGAFHFVLKGFFHGLTKRTKTDIDDMIFDIVKLPIFTAINLVGIFMALGTLSFVEQYMVLIEGVFVVAAAALGSYTASKIVSLLASRALSTHGGVRKAPNMLVKVISAVVYLIALFAVLSHFDVDITAGIAALGVGGIAIGLALQGTLTDFFSGMHILTDRPVNVGDYVEISSEGIEGYVLDIGWRSTRIKTLPGNIVIIPNSKLANSVITNTTLENKEMGFTIDCGVAYGSDLDRVEDASLEVAKEMQTSYPGMVRDYEPLFRFKEFGDSNINFYVVLRIEEFVNKYGVRNEFIKRLYKKFSSSGIEISWPVRKVFYGNEKSE